ncbi:MAG: hypothetical protein DRK00_00325 [Thermoprotei archaeon]|nr:MAG: hypothetical protein DRK00_00325 [Thermoprotei archaeon]
MPKRCPECGGELFYDRNTKTFICTSCGRVYTRDELEAAYEALRESGGRLIGKRRPPL